VGYGIVVSLALWQYRSTASIKFCLCMS